MRPYTHTTCRSLPPHHRHHPKPLHHTTQCSSGLQAFISVASAIQSGVMDAGIAGGVESMSLNDMASSVPEVNPLIQTTMGRTRIEMRNMLIRLTHPTRTMTNR